MLKVFSGNDPMGPIFIDEPWHSNDSSRELHPATPSETTPSDRWNTGNPDAVPYPILQGSAHGDGSRDLIIQEFFAHADVLSGQSIGKISPPSSHIGDPPTIVDGGWLDGALAALHFPHEDAAILETSDLKMFARESSFWMEVWFGKKGKGANGADPIQYEARCRCKYLNQWIEERWGPALDLLSRAAIHYAAIIQGARYDLNNLMGACVAQCEDFARSRAESADEAGLSESMSWRMVSGLFDVAASGISAPFKVVEHVEELLDKVKKDREELGKGGYYGTLYNFLTKANDLMDATSGAVKGLTLKMEEAFDLGGDLHAPTWNGTYEDLEE